MTTSEVYYWYFTRIGYIIFLVDEMYIGIEKYLPQIPMENGLKINVQIEPQLAYSQSDFPPL